MEVARVDQWLWSVRIFKTRTDATEACRGGHVRVNGSPAKPATHVRVGDRVTARSAGRERVLEVVTVISKRVGAPVAAECLVDHTPPSDERSDHGPFARDPSAGRPTKRDRRQLDRLVGSRRSHRPSK